MNITAEPVTNNGLAKTRIPNRLINEKSPYLLQHAFNPVNWYPWGEEAFAKAKAENKPIFLSIGYSTCHWCHVMAHECFEDEEVASLLNESFIPVKVDKEERPDVDTVYMTVCQVATGHGGWPLTILMTPDQKPFYAATYIPKESRNGIIGLMDLLSQVAIQWDDNQEDLVLSGNQLAMILKEHFEDKSSTGELSKDLISLAVTQFQQNFDHDYGGFGNEPKFPSPHNLMFLLRYACLEKDEQALFMVENTLKHMYRGGIFDHIGYGFSRYSTDAKWLVPHFEKMLYDNALLATTYLEAYQYTKNPMYRMVAEQVLKYLCREMMSPEGGFYCAQDADSEGVEGKYYVFTPDEINKVLEAKDASFFCDYFGITKEGNFEGASIPNLIKAPEIKSSNERLIHCCEKIYQFRQDCNNLHKDDKILTSWNALTIVAFARAAKVLQNEEYLDIARNAVEFINRTLTKDKVDLYVRYRDGSADYPGLLDDYAFYSMALIEMYDSTFEPGYLRQALDLTEKMLDKFWDDKGSGFFLNAKDAEQLIYRPKEVYDGAIPSGNSVAGYVLQRLSHITGCTRIREYADKQLSFLAGQVKDYPAGHSFSLMAFIAAIYPAKEIVCVAREDTGETGVSQNTDAKINITELKNYLASNFQPNTIVILKTQKNEDELEKIAPFTKDYTMVKDKVTYYICENRSCQAPVNELNTK
ncbi:MAG TPA: thioredoxin domain-containing protein [Clostridiales bacterium]|nr:thioredoxin domain-containing protein [Clostridiales bacterium]